MMNRIMSTITVLTVALSIASPTRLQPRERNSPNVTNAFGRHWVRRRGGAARSRAHGPLSYLLAVLASRGRPSQEGPARAGGASWRHRRGPPRSSTRGGGSDTVYVARLLVCGISHIALSGNVKV